MDLQIEASVSAHRRDFSSPAAFPPHQPQQFESHNNIQHYSPSPPPVVDGTAKRRALESAPSSPAPGPGSLPTSTSLAAPPAVKSHKRRRTANNVPTDLVDPSNPDSNTTKKMFVCKGYGNCKMAFSRSEHLARHVRKHTGERPFQCHCGRDFSRLDNLRQHAQTVHSDTPEKNAAMMSRLQSVHNALSTSSRAKRAKAAAAAAHHQSTVQQVPAYGTLSSSQSPPSAVSDYPQGPAEHYLGGGRPLLMESNYIGYSDHPHYHHHHAPVYTHYTTADLAYDRPTLPPISALIPRQGAHMPAMHSPLMPSPTPSHGFAQEYVGGLSPASQYSHSMPVSAANMPSVLSKSALDPINHAFYFPNDAIPMDLPAHSHQHLGNDFHLRQPSHDHQAVTAAGQLMFYPPRLAQSSDRSTSYGVVVG